MDEYIRLQIALLNKQLGVQEKAIRLLESNYKQMVLILNNINEVMDEQATQECKREAVRNQNPNVLQFQSRDNGSVPS